MPDMFSRFGDEMPIPGRLKIITRGEGNNEEVIQVVHEKRRGRQKEQQKKLNLITCQFWKKGLIPTLR